MSNLAWVCYDCHELIHGNTLPEKLNKKTRKKILKFQQSVEWLENPARLVLLYREGLMLCEARQVDFFANAKLKRKGPGRPTRKGQSTGQEEEYLPRTEETIPAPTISFAEMVAAQEKHTSAGGGEE